jgi:hypothetical protein
MPFMGVLFFENPDKSIRKNEEKPRENSSDNRKICCTKYII